MLANISPIATKQAWSLISIEKIEARLGSEQEDVSPVAGSVVTMARWNLITSPLLLMFLCFFAAHGEPFLGEVRCMAFNFAPRGFLKADGQTLSIAQNTGLFAVIGTKYGGDGRTTFALPKLSGLTTEDDITVDCFIAVQGIFPSRN
ncbi:hypothetical protein OS493_018532 [Desmophyllum pertusum]|uniref:Phage tail collar domain-containing protein n=1 Tax=Desmophyllum pertusum TaxID=174260 RepID=A0A9X0D983_9CNID|nr:hypothetical protein OS493_018532 [Desmophyllum pertusum]